MSETIGHECGIAALYWLKKSAGRGGRASRLVKSGNITSFLPAMLMDLQNRGQLAAALKNKG
jgi:hypothetical protein